MKTVTRIDVITAPVDEVKRLRVAAYCRVSTDSDAQLESLEAQKSHYEQYISRHPEWELAGIYYDEAMTGTKDTREEFQRLLADYRAGSIDMVITKSVSRFARNTVTSLETVRELKAIGVDGKVTLAYGTFLGYDKGEDGNLVVNEKEARIVRLIYRKFMEGMAPIGICRMLDEMGILTPGGKKHWHESTILSILKNKRYKGEAILQKSFCTDFLTKKTKKNEGEFPQYHVKDSLSAAPT